MMKLLLDTGADVNARDIMNRTPLYFACKYSNVEAVKLLILYKPNPFVITKNGHSIMDVVNNAFIKMYIERTKQVTIVLKVARPSRRLILWKYWTNYIINDPFAKNYIHIFHENMKFKEID